MKFVIVLFDFFYFFVVCCVLCFSEVVLVGGYEIVCLFFYQDGVYSVLVNVVSGQDEFDLFVVWCELVECNGLDVVVCIVVVLCCGVLNVEEVECYGCFGVNFGVLWELFGFGQLYEVV